MKTEDEILMEKIRNKKAELNIRITESNFDLLKEAVQKCSDSLEELLNSYYRAANKNHNSASGMHADNRSEDNLKEFPSKHPAARARISTSDFLPAAKKRQNIS